MDMTDPKKLVITTPSRQNNTPDPDGNVVFLGAHDFLNQSVNQISEYVQQFGTLKTLTIVGHGNSLEIASEHNGTDPTTDFYIPKFLNKLMEVQNRTGIKIADRIVFDACATMSGLQPVQVDLLRTQAKYLGSEIVGATTSIIYNAHPKDKAPIVDKYERGLFVAFHPDGTVSRDRLSTTASDVLKYNEAILDKVIADGSNFFTQLTGIDKSVAQKLKAQFAVDPSQNGEPELTALNKAEKTEAKWFACHDGKSQAEGAACQLGGNGTLPESDPLPTARADSRNMSEIKSTKPPPVDGAKPDKSMPMRTIQNVVGVPAAP